MSKTIAKPQVQCPECPETTDADDVDTQRQHMATCHPLPIELPIEDLAVLRNLFVVQRDFDQLTAEDRQLIRSFIAAVAAEPRSCVLTVAELEILRRMQDEQTFGLQAGQQITAAKLEIKRTGANTLKLTQKLKPTKGFKNPYWWLDVDLSAGRPASIDCLIPGWKVRRVGDNLFLVYPDLNQHSSDEFQILSRCVLAITETATG